jgi:23S rRNA pseudouridine2605 synthase
MSEDSRRISKVIARTGFASRREAEGIVEEGRVSVNGEVVHHPGHPVTTKDRITIDGNPLPRPPSHVYYLLNKPRGVITGRNDPDGRKSVFDLLETIEDRVEPVGRLDMDTEGVLLFTNDGDLAHQLTHPSMHVPKRYMVKVWRAPNERTLDRLRKGVRLEDGRTNPCKIRVVEQTDGGNAWLEVTVTEGRNRLIRRMFEHVNHPVSKLRRESFATISARNCERGHVRMLTREEHRRLIEIAGGTDPKRAGQNERYKKGYARPKPKNDKGTRKRRTLNKRRK